MRSHFFVQHYLGGVRKHTCWSHRSPNTPICGRVLYFDLIHHLPLFTWRKADLKDVSYFIFSCTFNSDWQSAIWPPIIWNVRILKLSPYVHGPRLSDWSSAEITSIFVKMKELSQKGPVLKVPIGTIFFKAELLWKKRLILHAIISIVWWSRPFFHCKNSLLIAFVLITKMDDLNLPMDPLCEWCHETYLLGLSKTVDSRVSVAGVSRSTSWTPELMMEGLWWT